MRHPAPGSEPALALVLLFMTSLNHNFFQEFIQTFIERAQALAVSAALAAPVPDLETRDV